MTFHTHNKDGFPIYYSKSSFGNDILNFEKERKEILDANFISSGDKLLHLSKLAEIAYLNNFQEFSATTFRQSIELLENPLEFYECLNLLRFLQVTDFENLKEKMSIELHTLSEDEKYSFNDKLLLKLKTIEYSTSNMSAKLNEELLSGLLNPKEKLRINRSLADCIPHYIFYQLKNNSSDLAKIILTKFDKYLVDIIELMILTNNQSSSPALLNSFLTDFLQSISSENIGNEKFNELQILIEKI